MRQTDRRSRNLLDITPAVADLTRNRVGSVTLTALATSTTVAAPNAVSVNSHISLEPLNANAASAARPYVKVTDRSRDGFVITHASSANTDQDFTWFVWEPSTP